MVVCHTKVTPAKNMDTIVNKEAPSISDTVSANRGLVSMGIS